jgi:hypothetical protein
MKMNLKDCDEILLRSRLTETYHFLTLLEGLVTVTTAEVFLPLHKILEFW